jgi:hypothetical protein
MAIGFSKITNVIRAVWQGAISKGSTYYVEYGGTNFNKGKRLATVLSNPAALFLFIMLPDLASMAKFKLYREGAEEEGSEIPTHPILDMLKGPNPMQTQEQFIWDYMFWRLLGSANMLSDSRVLKPDGGNVVYWLAPDCIEWSTWFQRNARTLFLSDQSIKDLGNQDLKYVTDSQSLKFKYKQLRIFSDISNGIHNWFEPPSRVDALHKVIKNSDNVLNSKNITSHLAGKFMVTGKHAAEDTSTLPMGAKEVADIEQKVMSDRSIHGIKSMVDVKRFLNDLGEIEKLDKAFMNDAFFIGKMLGIPKDVIEGFEVGATYENQEKARALTVSYCIQAAMDDFTRGILSFYGVKGYVLKATYGHLPFVQTFEKTRAETADKTASAFKKLVEGGADQQQAATFLRLPITVFTEPRQIGGSTTDAPEEDSDSKMRRIS